MSPPSTEKPATPIGIRSTSESLPPVPLSPVKPVPKPVSSFAARDDDDDEDEIVDEEVEDEDEIEVTPTKTKTDDANEDDDEVSYEDFEDPA